MLNEPFAVRLSKTGKLKRFEGGGGGDAGAEDVLGDLSGTVADAAAGAMVGVDNGLMIVFRLTKKNLSGALMNGTSKAWIGS